jgi:hypothetical protein
LDPGAEVIAVYHRDPKGDWGLRRDSWIAGIVLLVFVIGLPFGYLAFIEPNGTLRWLAAGVPIALFSGLAIAAAWILRNAGAPVYEECRLSSWGVEVVGRPRATGGYTRLPWEQVKRVRRSANFWERRNGVETVCVYAPSLRSWVGPKVVHPVEGFLRFQCISHADAVDFERRVLERIQPGMPRTAS